MSEKSHGNLKEKILAVGASLAIWLGYSAIKGDGLSDSGNRLPNKPVPNDIKPKYDPNTTPAGVPGEDRGAGGEPDGSLPHIVPWTPPGVSDASKDRLGPPNPPTPPTHQPDAPPPDVFR